MTSGYDTYRIAMAIAVEDYPFSALIQAAMRQADTDNLEKLKEGWPKVWEELQERYNAPGGFLESDVLAAMAKGEFPAAYFDPKCDFGPR